ncbi:MAG: hypothetical protein PHV11_01400 [Candidatus Bipolaricaulis sp.]|nr:hypothetical protein [Candidatus Bipolaricaulis sp.]
MLEGAVSVEATADGVDAMWGVAEGQGIELTRSGEMRSREADRELWPDGEARARGFSWWSLVWILLGAGAALLLVAAALGA